jgi:hypothetical protein
MFIRGTCFSAHCNLEVYCRKEFLGFVLNASSRKKLLLPCFEYLLTKNKIYLHLIKRRHMKSYGGIDFKLGN